MIEEVKDLMEDVKDKVGDNGFTFIILALVAVGIYLVYRSFSSGSAVEYAPTSVTGYPSVGENADVVMDSVNNAIEGSYNDLSSNMNSRFEYIDGILDEIQTDIDKSTNEIIQNTNQNTESVIQSSNQNTNTIVQTSNQNTNSIIQNSNQNTQSIIQNSNQNKQEVQKVVEEVKQVVSKVDNTENVTQSYTPPKPTVTTPEPTVTTPAKPSVSYYTYTTKSGLNTSTSIVDALKATGTDSSFAHRKAIAQANGISNYTGSYSQNVTLLNKMKSGQLIKA